MGENFNVLYAEAYKMDLIRYAYSIPNADETVVFGVGNYT